MNWKIRFLPLLLAAALVLGGVTAFADGEPAAPPAVQNEAQTALAPRDTITTEENLTYTVNDDGQTVTLTDGRSATGSITIPAAVEQDGTSYPVTSVGDFAFQYCGALESVTFSGNIDSIGDSAFYYCIALENVTFSGDVGSIGDSAFVNCTALKTVTFYGNVTSVGGSAFNNCDALESVTFSGNVGSIGNFAFYGCGALESVTFSGSVGSIGDSAFYGCGALESVTFSGNIDSIGDEAFSHCFDLKNVTFSGDVDSIEDFAFWACTALKTLTFSGDVRSIEYGAFSSCSALNTVTFSGDVGSIDDSAFYNCTALTTIYVPNMSDEKIEMIETALDRSGLLDVKIERSAPEQPSDPAPDTPPVPSTGTPSTPSTGTTSTGSAVQLLEAAERPDPMDVEATERYNFWMGVKSDLRAAGDGKTVRVYVPADYTNMPASVMETIRTLGKEITIDLRWNGQRLIITPQTALKRPPLKAFWTFDALCEVYAR